MPVTLAAIGIAWALAIIAMTTGRGEELHHGTLIEDGIETGRLTFWAAIALFLLAWQAMIAAMMLPSSLPFIRLFSRVASAQPRARPAKAALNTGQICLCAGVCLLV